MSDSVYPLRFKPIYKDYIWGGDRIIKKYDRGEPEGVYAESWEVADREEGMSVVVNGPLAGKTLAELVKTMGKNLMGTSTRTENFPLLVKLIDSKQCLSVQVHPSDVAAIKYGGEAKTEMWYVLDADENAQVYAAMKKSVTEMEFKDDIEYNNLEEVLATVPVQKGDAVFIPGGRVHAIDAGCLLLEIQQNSNTTYRIYDWGRTGADGKSRPLHINQALQVINWGDQGDAKVTPMQEESVNGNELWEILETSYFKLERADLVHDWTLTGRGTTFQILFVAEGTVTLEWEGGTDELVPGTTCLIPAALPACRVIPKGGPAQVLRVTHP